MTIILMAIALTILCICSVAELAVVIFLMLKTSHSPSNTNKPVNSNRPTEPTTFPSAPATDEEELAKARKRYAEEMTAFQELMNYNANVAYGIEPMEEFKE